MKNVTKIICIILNILAVLAIVNIIIYYPITHFKQKKLDVKNFREDISEPQLELYDLDVILAFNEHIYCLNSRRDCIMVFSMDGVHQKSMYLKPGRGLNRMYIYHEQLCILDKFDNLYQYSSVDEYKKIVLENENEVQIFDKTGEKINTIKVDGKYDLPLLVLDEKCYLDKYDNNYISVFDESGKVGTEKGDYETIVEGGNKKECIDKDAVYRIGKLGNKIIKEENGKKEIFKSTNLIQVYFLSSKLNLIMHAVFVASLFIKYKILKAE